MLEIFILVLQQCHKESEDKWKRLSRQIADVILPMLAKQQVCAPSASLLWSHCDTFLSGSAGDWHFIESKRVRLAILISAGLRAGIFIYSQ